jgi:hypothetical protein
MMAFMLSAIFRRHAAIAMIMLFVSPLLFAATMLFADYFISHAAFDISISLIPPLIAPLMPAPVDDAFSIILLPFSPFFFDDAMMSILDAIFSFRHTPEATLAIRRHAAAAT